MSDHDQSELSFTLKFWGSVVVLVFAGVATHHLKRIANAIERAYPIPAEHEAGT